MGLTIKVNLQRETSAWQNRGLRPHNQQKRGVSFALWGQNQEKSTSLSG